MLLSICATLVHELLPSFQALALAGAQGALVEGALELALQDDGEVVVDGWGMSTSALGRTTEDELLTFTGFELGAQIPGNLRAEIASLRRVAPSKAKSDHQVVHDASNVLETELPVNRWAIREAEAGERGNDDVVREGLGGVLLLEEVQEGEELEEGPCERLLEVSEVCKRAPGRRPTRPAMQENQGDGVLLLREKTDKVDGEILLLFIIDDSRFEVGQLVDA